MKVFKVHNPRANHIASVLAWIALECGILSWGFNIYQYIPGIIANKYDFFAYYFENFFSGWGFVYRILIFPIALVILAIFLHRYYKKPLKTNFLAIIFCQYVLYIFPIISSRVNYGWFLSLSALFPNSAFLLRLSQHLEPIINLIILPLSIFAVIEVLCGLKIKLFSVIVPTLCAISSFPNFALVYFYGKLDIMLAVANLSGALAASFFHLAILVFVLCNRIPAIIHLRNKKKAVSPEQELKDLMVHHELGHISDEEFQSRREEIISKL